MVSEGSFLSLLPGFWFQERQLPPQLIDHSSNSGNALLVMFSKEKR